MASTSNLSQFLEPNSRLLKDVSFLVSSGGVNAHKCLLACRHEYFRKLFFKAPGGIARTVGKVYDLQ